jgi:hypothetical protein
MLVSVVTVVTEASLALDVSAASRLDIPKYGACEDEWPRFLAQHGKEDSEERKRRFCSNLEKVVLHNERATEHGYTTGLNWHADLSESEAASRLGHRCAAVQESLTRQHTAPRHAAHFLSSLCVRQCATGLRQGPCCFVSEQGTEWDGRLCAIGARNGA